MHLSSQLPAGVPLVYGHFFDGEFGFIKDCIHRTKWRQGMVLVSAKLRQLPLALRQPVTELRRLKDDDVIEWVSVSECVSPLVVTCKKNGTIQLCVILREPNKAIIINGYLLPYVKNCSTC